MVITSRGTQKNVVSRAHRAKAEGVFDVDLRQLATRAETMNQDYGFVEAGVFHGVIVFRDSIVD